MRIRILPLLGLVAAAAVGCDHGLSPPEDADTGVIRVHVEYVQEPQNWPVTDSLRDLRFVAMRFVPRDTTDFLQLNRLIFSERMTYYVSEETVVISDVETGSFLYAGVAQKFGPDNFDWRPVGLVTENSGFFSVAKDETTHVYVQADFVDRPPFPPPVP